MTTEPMIVLVSADAERAIGDETEAVVMLTKAFSAAKNHWMVLDRDTQFKGALNAVLKKMGDDHPDHDRLRTEIRLLGQFNAFLQAAQVGLNPEVPEVPDGHQSFGLMVLWNNAVAA